MYSGLEMCGRRVRIIQILERPYHEAVVDGDAVDGHLSLACQASRHPGHEMGALSLGGEVRIGAIVVHGPESPTRELTGTTAEVDAREESLSLHQVRGRESLLAADEGLPVAGGDFGRIRIWGRGL